MANMSQGRSCKVEGCLIFFLLASPSLFVCCQCVCIPALPFACVRLRVLVCLSPSAGGCVRCLSMSHVFWGTRWAFIRASVRVLLHVSMLHARMPGSILVCVHAFLRVCVLHVFVCGACRKAQPRFQLIVLNRRSPGTKTWERGPVTGHCPIGSTPGLSACFMSIKAPSH